MDKEESDDSENSDEVLVGDNQPVLKSLFTFKGLVMDHLGM